MLASVVFVFTKKACWASRLHSMCSRGMVCACFRKRNKRKNMETIERYYSARIDEPRQMISALSENLVPASGG
jgi:hypothetical protein